jgi:hypothetical protein
LNWTKEFHVHIDASATTIGVVLTQGKDNKVDLPIYYASRFLNQTERNYITMQREALVMIYAMKKFRHYLLANRFIIFVDHQALVYMVNRLFISSPIACRLLLLLEFDFEVIYKQKKKHVVLDYLSRLEFEKGLPLMI